MMRLDALLSDAVDDTVADARGFEADGFRTVWAGESRHDVFLRCAAAATGTTSLRVGSSVAIAFARSPVTVASSGYDLARSSRGRFTLGLGSQVKSHIERRFSMPWSHPAARMKEFVDAVRAIWDNWENDTPLDFRGQFYQHTLMPDFFRPPRHEYGPPPVYLAAVGPLMTGVAGEVCEGFLFHPFTTVRYLTEVTVPALEAGRSRAQRDLGPIDVCGPVLAAVGRTEEELAEAVAGVRRQIAFYASTPAYRPVLEVHGWGEVADRLRPMSRQGQWAEMGAEIDDEVLAAFAVVGSPDDVAAELVTRFGGVADAVSLSTPDMYDESMSRDVVRALARVQDEGTDAA